MKRRMFSFALRGDFVRIVDTAKNTDQMLAIQSRYEKDHPYAERFTVDDLKNPLLNGRGNILYYKRKKSARFSVISFPTELLKSSLSSHMARHKCIRLPATNLMSLLFGGFTPFDLRIHKLLFSPCSWN